ncbi:hypothetical protein TBLA_0B03550 [Henningerozyma blattae CBS 6284]|uniref:Major facilitator superfamily (MFS) profile domain-containing protein n=1 Tax=Henningerozyma blattae (strain ATCC 34711 / CBS 6284 / DSM 70876 / NBRC 10599 / NRRL Y-10934 / UCD 77-7) TaxID=1071380 RepID=I2GYJ3_HENB6|nr:hypothetical protein TBLA_0B03550 [Tetrapisispora blattae CBS 6284]CCH59195.1 hypothetical protein TBLA_0B03550 [Tetrapisispora blattae CBS 6284]
MTSSSNINTNLDNNLFLKSAIICDNQNSSMTLYNKLDDTKHKVKYSNEKTRVINPEYLEWDGSDDLDNPHNWSVWKKWYVTLTAAALGFICTMGSSLYVSDISSMKEEFGYGEEISLSGLTFYLIGLSTVICAPLSKIFGRKLVYLVSLPLCMRCTMGIVLSHGHMKIILPLRYLGGMFASPPLSVGSGTIIDIFDNDETSIAMTFFCNGSILGSCH